jgi:hypothetical protein
LSAFRAVFCFAAGILVLSAATAPARAAAGRADTPAAYAQVVPVSVSGRQAVVQLPLPRAVYLAAHSSDLRDLRLFDAAGSPMPFALVERVQKGEVAHASAPVAVFAVRAAAGQRLPDDLRIRTRDDGTVMSVTPSTAHGPADRLASLVLDLRPPQPAAGIKAQVAALVVTPPPGSGNYSARVGLDASDDLQHWEPVTDAALSWLDNSQGERVQQNRIAFSPRPLRYARIRWLDGTPLEFAAIAADYVTETAASQQWDSLVLQAGEGGIGGDLAYAAPIGLPVESVGLVFQGNNVVLPALIGQYRERPRREPGGAAAFDLRPLASTTFFRMTQNGRQRASSDIDIPLTHARQWILRPQARVGEPPGLRLRWRPETVVFVAGGKPPYTLAFGRDGAQPAWQPLNQVAPGFSPSELAGLEQAQAGPALRQGDGRGDADSRLAGRSFWLWALLLGGVGALAFVAWRLTRQLKDGASGQPPA